VHESRSNEAREMGATQYWLQVKEAYAAMLPDLMSLGLHFISVGLESSRN
jgi:hypothetical protein